ncbi:MAG: Ig-like domain-containing protein [Muribaculaceae bacterium]
MGSILRQSATTANGETYTEFTFPTDTEYTYLALYGDGGVTYSDRIEVTWEVSGASDYDPAYATSEALVKNADGTYSLTLAEGEGFTLTPTTADGPTISYESSNTDVVDVDAGYILAMGQGTATITGSWSEVADTWNAGSVTINVTVTAADTRAEVLMEWDAAEASATLGGVYTLPNLTIVPEAALSDVVYSSSEPSVAEISADGTVTIKAAGTTTITAAIPDDNATYKPVTASYTLTVTDPSSTYYLVKSSAEFDPTQKCILVAYKSGSYSAAMGAQYDTKYREAVALDIHSAALPEQLNKPAGAVEFTLEKTAADATTYYINVGSAYLSLGTSGSDTKEVAQSSATKASLSFASDYRVTLTAGTSTRALGYNNTASPTRFASYTNSDATYTQVYLYQQRLAVEKEDAIIDWDDIETDAEVKRQLVGECTFPTLSVMPDEAAISVRYTSSNEAVATIDPVTGAITRLAVGSTTITAKIEGDEKYKNVYDTYTLTIEDDRDEVVITFSPASTSHLFRMADTFVWPYVSIKVSDVENEDARDNVKFKSSNKDVIDVDETYNVHQIQGVGEADIIAYIEAANKFYKPVEARCHVTIERQTVTMTFTPNEVSAGVFTDVPEPKLTIDPEDREIEEAIRYSSSDETVASVDAITGKVTVNKAGSAVITATFDNESESFNFKKATATYTVTATDTRVTPTITWSCGAEMTYDWAGGETFVSPTIAVAGGVVADDVKALLTYASSNEAIATVSEAGVVEIKGEGTAEISAKLPAGDATYAPTTVSFTLTVTNSNPDVYYLTASGETFADGDYIIIAAADKTNFVSTVKGTKDNDREIYTLSEAAGSTITPTAEDKFMIFKVVAAEGGVRLLTTNYAGANGYAACANNDTPFKIVSTATDNYSLFNITYESGNDAVIKNVGNSRWLRYNTSVSKFRFYSSNLGSAVYIYKKALAQKPDDPTFSQPDGTELTWQTAAVTVTSAHATKVYYRAQYYDADADEWIWSPDWTSVEGNYAVIYVHDPCHIEAYGENQYGKSETVTASYTIYGAGATIYNYINSLDQVDLSKKYILVNRDNKVAMGSYNESGKYHNTVEIGVATDGTSVTAQSALAFKLVSTSDPFGGGSTGDTDPTEPAAIIARAAATSTDTYNMLLDNGNYMKLNSNDSKTSEVATAAEATAFKVSFTDGMYVLLTDAASGRYLGCNVLSKRFSSYSNDSSYQITYLFQEGEKLVTGVEDIAVESADEAADDADVEWYTLQGVRVENPGTGFYIRRCGNKATKHLLK